MIRIEGGTHFLTVSEIANDKLSVKAYRTFAEIPVTKSSGLRVSPIFPTDKAPPPSFQKNKTSFLAFFGPIYPGKLDFSDAISIFLTLGTFNVIAFLDDKKSLDEVFSFVNLNNLNLEVWEIKTGVIENYQIYSNKPSTYDYETSLINVSEDLRISSREYFLLMSKCLEEAKKYWPEEYLDLITFDKGFNVRIKSEAEELSRLTSFVLTNAALSKFSSQTFAGCSPILRNECSYANNSLLGIGLATKVLSSLQRYSTKAFINSQLLERIKLLSKVKYDELAIIIETMSISNSFYSEDHLQHASINKCIGVGKPVMPNIVCFSGRDGFRSTRHSLSAPLETISSANTLEWTLMTLTHEITHTIIGTILGIFFPNPKSHSESSVERLFNKKKCTNLFELAEKHLLHGFYLLSMEGGVFLEATCVDELQDNDPPKTIEHIRNSLVTYSPEVNELLTHIFDFYYFYSRNEKLYIDSVWSSWAVVPNIENRLAQYLIRSLCTIYTNRTDWAQQNSYDALLDRLENLIKFQDDATSDVITRARTLLIDRKEHFLFALNIRASFVKFMKAFVYSPEVYQLVFTETVPHATSPGFRVDPIANPLHFIEHNSTEHRQPAMLKSIWILQHLAFNEQANE